MRCQHDAHLSRGRNQRAKRKSRLPYGYPGHPPGGSRDHPVNHSQAGIGEACTHSTCRGASMIDRSSLAERMRGMKETLAAGVQTVSAPSLFPTPYAVAIDLVELADIEPGHSVLEPSAGTGAILDAIKATVPSAIVEAVEYNQALAQALGARCADFLALTPQELGTFDRIVMNPPFGGAADIKHIRHALNFLKPGGRLVAICANGPRQNKAFGSNIVKELPSGTFNGTGVRSCIVVIDGREEIAKP